MASLLPGSRSYEAALRTGGVEVITSGTAMTIDDTLEITVADLRLRFEFRSEGKEPRMETKETGPGTATFILYNFDSALGIGTGAPFRIGDVLGQPLHMAFTIYRIGAAPIRNFHYTFYRGELRS